MKKKILKLFGKEQEVKKVLPDYDLLSEISPRGGVAFDRGNEKFTFTGDGYEACIYVYGYPRHVNEFWLSELTNINDTITILDIGTENVSLVKKNIRRSLEEQNSRHKDPKSNTTDKMDAEARFNELTLMYDELTSMGEVMKMVVTRIYVPAETLSDCDEAVKKIIVDLEGSSYKCSVPLNEGKDDYKAMFLPLSKQRKSIYRKKTQPILSKQLAGGNPFHYSKLNDPNGFFLGTTETGGSVIFDQFHIDEDRLSYNAILVGLMGSGKSTTLKEMLIERAIRGDRGRVFDKTGEFRTLVTTLGGKVINLDGKSKNIINVLQILKIVENDDEENKTESEIISDENLISYNRHFSKVTTFYKYLKPSATENEILMMESLLRKLYQVWGVIDTNGEFPKKNDTELDITKMGATNYPIWSDFLGLVKNELKEKRKDIDANRVDIDLIKNIELQVESICTTYKNIFDGHTTIEDIYDEKIVSFDITNLTAMKNEIFDAQLFNALSLCWDNCVSVGKEMKKLWDNGEIEFWDIKRFLIIIDEAHTVVNANKLAGVELLGLFSREARKYFGGLALASQSIRDFVPKDASKAGIDEISRLFELSTYKFILRQDSNTKDNFRDIFHSDFTEWELDKISKLRKGQAILSMSGYDNILMDITPSDENLKLFTGGA